ncbi:MAG: DUF2585 family protein [Phycisphaerales bacterium]
MTDVPTNPPAAPAPPTGRGPLTLWTGPALASLLVVLATIAAMRVEGREWFCACGEVRVWSGDVWSSHCSQHFLDPYSFTHFTHGLIFAGGLALLVPRVPHRWRFVGALVIAAAWEVLENSPMIINRYRSVTMSLDYLGDSVTNAVGDIACCGVGDVAAIRLGWKRSILLYLAIEVALLVLMRDNLALNVLMLIWPIDAIRQWQTPPGMGAGGAAFQSFLSAATS